jgi:hypothetical protein
MTAYLQSTIHFLRSLNRDAALDSMRNILAVIGAGAILGDFLTMRWYFVLPAFAFACAVWYADYLRHDLPSPLFTIKAINDLDHN